jgi:hypothetical protein
MFGVWPWRPPRRRGTTPELCVPMRKSGWWPANAVWLASNVLARTRLAGRHHDLQTSSDHHEAPVPMLVHHRRTPGPLRTSQPTPTPIAPVLGGRLQCRLSRAPIPSHPATVACRLRHIRHPLSLLRRQG